MTNRDRAEAARDALATFTARTYHRTPEQLGAPDLRDVEPGDGRARPDYADLDAGTMLGDLLCDLQHYAHAVGLDFAEQLDRGTWHYTEERSNPWDEDE